jgi:urea carboxylase/allophanate hydrolase
LKEFNRLIQISNSELDSSNVKPIEEEVYNENAQLVYSEFSGRFWKSLIEVGDKVQKGQGLVVIEAMKTEMVVLAPQSGTVLKVVHKNGDMVDAGDMVVIIE